MSVTYEGFYSGQAQHVRIVIPEFRRMRRHGKTVNKSVIFVSRNPKPSNGTVPSSRAPRP
jgi:hypothetical protein